MCHRRALITPGGLQGSQGAEAEMGSLGCCSSAPRRARTGSFSAPFPPPACISSPRALHFLLHHPARDKIRAEITAPLGDRPPASPVGQGACVSLEKNMYFRPAGR